MSSQANVGVAILREELTGLEMKYYRILVYAVVLVLSMVLVQAGAELL